LNIEGLVAKTQTLGDFVGGIGEWKSPDCARNAISNAASNKPSRRRAEHSVIPAEWNAEI
jgi:hypothetical protein